MTEEQKEFWQGVTMHFVIAAFVAINALPFIEDAPFALRLLSIAVGAGGGLLMASRALALHATHRPSLPRGMAEGLVIMLVVYALLQQLEGMPRLWQLGVASVMLALPAWFAAYAVFMLVETLGRTRAPSRF